MKVPPCRWQLPAGHLIVDTMLAALLVSGSSFLLTSGNLPAAVLSTALARGAHDTVWFPIHEVVSCSIWFLIGLGIDAGRFRLRREMLVYLGFRAACTALLPAVNLARTAASLEVLFWLALSIWSVGWCVFRAVQRLSTHKRGLA
jgi:hypothetical protein